jgi:hypothetical protein
MPKTNKGTKNKDAQNVIDSLLTNKEPEVQSKSFRLLHQLKKGKTTLLFKATANGQ